MGHVVNYPILNHRGQRHCTKRVPKDCVENATVNSNYYPLCRRRDSKKRSEAKFRGENADNRKPVECNVHPPSLRLQFLSDVELCSTEKQLHIHLSALKRVATELTANPGR